MPAPGLVDVRWADPLIGDDDVVIAMASEARGLV